MAILTINCEGEILVLQTNRCKLLQITEADYEDVKNLYVDQGVRKYLGGIRTDEQYKMSFLDMINSRPEFSYWVVRYKETNEFIGLVSLDLGNDGVSTEVSYQILPKWWGKGYATEIVQFVINYGFTELKLPRLIAETQTANIQSCKLLERVGMILETKVHRFEAEQSIYSIVNKGL